MEELLRRAEERAGRESKRWEKMQQSIDLLFSQMESIDKTQLGMMAQLELFISAVESKFGAYDYRRALADLLEIKQEGTVEEYTTEFESVRFQVSMHNPAYDDMFFALHFVKGLQDDIRSAVESQAPETVDRASFLARVQQHVMEKNKLKHEKHTLVNKSDTKLGSPSTTSTLWKERQLRDYRSANNLCYFCGDKFELGHAKKCTKRPKSQLNVLVVNDLIYLCLRTL
ncbi:hypothetical protein PR202_ga06532 [Eleusine coracana subsp. coracana]|uniref:Retrotransposon gag domain-containing protein n=1 Tax=Eleusine coracana subsp. coracana TaxID=191504 RepID=A0AAV5BVA9_ELECO|nr:hypothetical protein PR202_ga06532 [Eleusine coracana subsp. coracana]